MSGGSGHVDGVLRRASTALRLLDAVTPRPLFVRRMAGLAYGPLPRHRLDVYRPSGGDPPRPLLVFLHGGGWETGRRAEYAFAGRAYASKGFVTAIPDYRLTGHAPYPAFLEDCARAVAWCQGHAAELGADADRTVLVGHSAGAYNAAMLTLDARWLAAAGADRRLRGWAGLSGPYDFLPLEPGPGLRTFGDAGDLPATQPIVHAQAGAPPAFLAAGDRDTVVDPVNTRRLAERLQALAVPVREQVYRGIGHAGPLLGLAWPFSLRVPVLAQSAAFLHAAASPGERWPGND